MFKKRILPVLLIIVACVLIYTSKMSYYQNKVAFFEKDISGIVSKISEGRGTKVYYQESDFFYLEQCKVNSINIGDSLSKRRSSLKVFRKTGFDNFILFEEGKVLKPKSSYFNFFFGF